MNLTDHAKKYLKCLEGTPTIDYFMSKVKRVPTLYEIEVLLELEELASDIKLPKGALNMVIDYTMQKNSNKLARKYIATIALSLEGEATLESAFIRLKKQIEVRKRYRENKKAQN